jgi:protein-disulfide isomerase
MAGNGRKTNWFAIWISVAVVAVLIVVGVVVAIVNNQATAAGDVPSGSNIDSKTGAIHVGEGDDTLATYIDFMCPVCNNFEQTYGSSVQRLVDDGTITLDIHPISILDRSSQGTQYSTRAANAMYCVAVQDPDASAPFMQAMFENQPAESTPGLTDDQILDIASGVGVTDIDACVHDGTYSEYVAEMTGKTPVQPGANGIGTPTIAVNGQVIANSSLPDPLRLATLFE